MINIRYHIVSITAVFLALGIGVALGSTFLDRATVDVLDRNIRSAENRIDATNAENARLTEELEAARDRDDALILVGSDELLSEQLTDQPVLVIAAPGTDGDDTAALSTILDRSDADVRGVLRMSDEMLFGGDVDTDLAADLELDGEPTAEELRTETYDQLRAALAAAGAPAEAEGGDDGTSTPPDATTTTTTAPDAEPDGGAAVEPGDDPAAPDGTQPEIVSTLLDRGYLTLEPGSAGAEDQPILEETGYRYVVVGAPDLDTDQNDAVLELLGDGSDDLPLPATVITATQGQPTGDEQAPAPTVVALVRGSEQLGAQYNTVDDADWFSGLVATVLTLDRMGAQAVGHYGVADGATAVLPENP